MRRKRKNILVMTKIMAMMMKSGVGLGERDDPDDTVHWCGTGAGHRTNRSSVTISPQKWGNTAPARDFSLENNALG